MYTLIHLLPSLFKVKRKVDILQVCLDVLVTQRCKNHYLKHYLQLIQSKLVYLLYFDSIFN